MIYPDKRAEKDTIQILFFGKGYGESILVHLGYDKYILIDSFIDTETKNPVALDYLTHVGLNANAIVGIICTHWDDDHIKGISNIIENINNLIDVYIPMAFSKRDSRLFIEYVNKNKKPNRLNSTSELNMLFELKEKSKIKIRFAKENVFMFSQILKTINKEENSIIALSPSDETILQFLNSVFSEVDTKNEFHPHRKNYISNNNVSVVTLITNIVKGILLGADLENTNNAWDYIADNYHYETKCDVFKIPHHGSENAHNPKVWNSMVENPISIITRFNRNKILPTDSQIDIIKNLSESLFVIGKKTKNRDVENIELGVQSLTTEEMLGELKPVDTKIGMVSLSLNHGKWDKNFYGSVESK